MRAGLVDDVAYEDELDDKVKLGEGRRRTSSSTSEYRQSSPSSLGLNRGPRIAVHLRRRASSLGREQLRLAAGRGRRLRHDHSTTCGRRAPDDSIKAIVLRIDSPGGSAIASDVIWREVS